VLKIKIPTFFENVIGKNYIPLPIIRWEFKFYMLLCVKNIEK